MEQVKPYFPESKQQRRYSEWADAQTGLRPVLVCNKVRFSRDKALLEVLLLVYCTYPKDLVTLPSCQPRVTVASCFVLQSYQGVRIDRSLVY